MQGEVAWVVTTTLVVVTGSYRWHLSHMGTPPFPTYVGPNARSRLQFSWCDFAELLFCTRLRRAANWFLKCVPQVYCLSRLADSAYISLPVAAPSSLVILVLLMMGSQHGLAVVAPVACSPAPTATSVAGSWGWLCESRKQYWRSDSCSRGFLVVVGLLSVVCYPAPPLVFSSSHRLPPTVSS